MTKRTTAVRAGLLGHSALAGMAALCATFATPALAQDEPAATSGEDDVIYVSARRREESLQETPVAVSAFTAETLETRQITQTQDLERITPSLQFKPAGQLSGNSASSVVFIRGIGQLDPTAAVDPGVGVYIDDVYVGRAVGGTIEFGDIDQVEVLRGPQGTLFGRNTIGGAIQVRTRTPELGEWSARGRLRVGSDSLHEGFAALNVPLAETMAARVSGGFRKRDGYVIRVVDGLDLGNDDVYTFNGALLWEAAPGLDINLRADYTRRDENGAPFVFAGINETAPIPAIVSVAAGCPGATMPFPGTPAPGAPFVPNIDDSRCANDFQARGEYVNGGTAPVLSTSEVWGVSGSAVLELNDALTLKSITAYRSTQSRGVRDGDNTPFLIITTDVAGDSDQFSQELQVQFETGPFDGIVGAYYFDEDTLERASVPLSFPPSPPVIASILAGNGGSRDLQFSTLETRSWALFGETSVELTDALSVSGGLRYTRDRKSYTGIVMNLFPGTQPDPATLPDKAIPDGGPLFIYPTLNRDTYSALTGSASVSYAMADWLNGYVSYARSFKSGGFNTRYNAPPPGNRPVSFAEESVDSYELGLKADWDGVRLNLAAFQANYDDIQLIFRQGVVPLLFNAGKARIRGFEAETSIRPFDSGLTFDAGLSILDDEILTITPVPGATATVAPGDDLPLTPSFTANFSVGYEFEVADLVVTPRVQGNYSSSVVFITGSVPEIEEDGYFTADASVNVAVTDVVSVQAGVTNLFDERYLIQGNASLGTLGYTEKIYARPRAWYVQLSADF
ncbi:TonB-dependent receptor [Alteraurantiacibacter buctensis]|uniref:TonB-dependent receptor n=1 Tax=Alteraurantiacibacter buctensis TaxID=1503981 RepID=A0A844YR67_9SPHN|nr:TonB-dependent receptor [Alteraurantiacibacter buctensis]MXO70845.1 TonB-dependent receptor [Alteraurantiacibacter buctensis]